MRLKSILRHILEGKEAVTLLMERVPGELMEKLTSGQRAATRMILETSDRFTVVHGLCRCGEDHTVPGGDVSREHAAGEWASPCRGLGPTHRAVGEMRSAGVGCTDAGVLSA